MEQFYFRTNSQTCRYCGAAYNNVRDLVDHLQAAHPLSKVVLPVNLICTICGKKIALIDQLAAHYRDDHHITGCEIESSAFWNATEFYKWKSDLEAQSYSYYAKRRRTVSDDDVTVFFSCASSWGDNRTALREKRTERHCPAFIRGKWLFLLNLLDVR